MKLLRIAAWGLPLFEDMLEVTLYARQRVSGHQKEMLLPLFSNVYANPVTACIGINASGKTSVLNALLLALGILNGESINHIENKDTLGESDRVELDAYFYEESARKVCRLQTIIQSSRNKAGGVTYRIAEESLWEKEAGTAARKNLLDFKEKDLAMTRKDSEPFLPEDVSIVIARIKQRGAQPQVFDFHRLENSGFDEFLETMPAEVLPFLDSSVENFQVEGFDENLSVLLKFYGRDAIALSHPGQLEGILSSGTLRGMRLFALAREVFANGGYLVVDDIEKHLNREITATLLRFFMDPALNRKGGMLIFSTHDGHLLDEFDRSDNIFITRNRTGITLQNLCEVLKRNDLKKSEAYQSGWLEETTPGCEAYLRLKTSLQEKE